jgi:hypothetical protein
MECFICKTFSKPLTCSKCKTIWYCSKQCQKIDWKEHKKWCGRIEEKICISLWGAMDAISMGGACMASSLILSDALEDEGIPNKIVTGYAVLEFDEGNLPCLIRHVWVEVGGVILETSFQCRQMLRLIRSYVVEPLAPAPLGGREQGSIGFDDRQGPLSLPLEKYHRFDRETSSEIKQSDELEELMQLYSKHQNKKKIMKIIERVNPIWKQIRNTVFHTKDQIILPK